MISKCYCPKCKETVKTLKKIENKLERISDAMEYKENFSKLELEQILLAVTLFENQFYGLDRSIKVMTQDDHDGFVIAFNQLRQQLYDFLAMFD
jgi:hypothetical protein